MSRRVGSRKGAVVGVHIEGLESRRMLSAVQLGDYLYFANTDAAHGTELWKSDLDGGNAQIVKDIWTGTGSSSPHDLFVFQDKVFFAANGGIGYGIELWSSDGTEAGTTMINIQTGHASANPKNFIVLNDHFVFTTDYTLQVVYSSDGTQAGTSKLVRTGFAVKETVPVLLPNGLAQFSSTPLGGSDVTVTYNTDGTREGTFIVPVGGVLPVEGTSSADTIALTSANGVTTITVNGVSHDYDNAEFAQIIVEGWGGADSVIADASVTTPMRVIARGTIITGSGNDTIIGTKDIVSIDGGAGTNTADFSRSSYAQTLNNSNEITSALFGTTHLANIQRLFTGDGNDQLNVLSNGTGGIQYVDAGGGNDVVVFLRHAAGATVHGGAGNDDILIRNYADSAVYYGDGGDDVFRVYRSSNTTREFFGGDGTDTLDYSAFQWPYGSTRISLDDVANDGSSGESPLFSFNDNVHSDIEAVIGTDGADLIIGSVNGTTIFAGKGNDRIQLVSGVGTSNKVYGQAGDDTVIGGAGADRMYGGDGNDWMSGGLGNDTIYGEAGNDRLFGGDGRDYLDGGAGADVLRGEAGQDRIVVRVADGDDFKGNSGDILTLLV